MTLYFRVWYKFILYNVRITFDEKAKKERKMEYISSNLSLMNISCRSIHVDTEQADREQKLDNLKTGAVQILLTTDETSQIDMENIT